jgi:nicotinate-nucleotide--dimethylbenzimidazole phosphoribosyltransferase
VVTPSPPLQAVLFDVGGTLLRPADPATPVPDLRAVPLPGVPEGLRRLARSYRLGAVTNTAVMREGDVRAHLCAAGLDGLLEVVVTSVDVGAAKPDPAPLRAALERLGVAPQAALYVGDLPSDRQAAQAAGCAFAYVGDGIEAAVASHLARASRPFFAAARRIAPLDPDALRWAEERQARLAKPPGSLGALERLGVRLAGIAGRCPPPDPAPAAVAVFAADHGVVEEGVSLWPREVTALVASAIAGGRAGVSVLARSVGASVRVVDVGVATDLSSVPGVRAARVRAGTANLAAGPAMSEQEALDALDAGVRVASELVEEGARCLITGEVGIGNTTAAAALIAALTGRRAREVVGRGAGADDATLARKAAVIDAACGRLHGQPDPVRVLAEVGGLEIAALAGLAVGGAAARVPVLVDGAIACAALLVAAELAPGVADYCVAGHRSAEPCASIALEHLSLEPLLELGLRLGEGTGACLALPLVRAAARVLAEMATLDEL